jgi:glycine/D-amino acid oxidase-like deaminating enzyme
LPLIGPVPGMKGVYAAYGYGGNGITFSFLAAQLIGGLIAGSTSPLLTDFALDRDGKPGRAHGDGVADAGAPLLSAN